ncbi:hypothetical protein Tco_0107807, partial [Tanacetum coccineum]
KAEAEMAQESRSKRACTELEQEVAKKQKIDDDQEEAKMKRHMEIVLNEEEVAVDAIPLATKPPTIMLQSIDREDLETLWKLVKAKHGSTRLEEEYERVLWSDLKVMFEPDVENLKSEYLYAGRKEISIYTCYNHWHAQQEASIDQWNEMSCQLLNLITKQLKNPGSV